MRRCDLLGKRNILLLHRIEQEVMEVTLRADGRDIFLQGRTHIEQRRCVLSKTIIDIGEIAIVPRTKALLMDPPLHQGKVARVLGTDPPCRVPHVADGEGDGLMIELRRTVLLLQCLMHPSLVEKPTAHPQEADVRRTPDLMVIIILIHMHNRQKDSIFMRHHDIHHR